MREAARKQYIRLDLHGLMAQFDSWLGLSGILSPTQLERFCRLERPFFKAYSEPDISATGHIIHAVQLREFAQYYMGISAATSGTTSSEVSLRAEMTRVLDLLANKYAFEQEIAKRGLEMSGRNGFFWLSPGGADDHAELGGSHPALPLPAETVRNRLGLAHFDRAHGEVLSLRIEVSNLPSPRTPTTFDACGYAFFRPALRHDGWGETINLADAGKGVREAIHAGTRVSEGVRVTVLGKLDKGRVRFSARRWARLLHESERELEEWCDRGSEAVEV